MPNRALRCWYFSDRPTDQISRDLALQTETYEYFLVTERYILEGIIGGHLGRKGLETPYFQQHKRGLTYFNDYATGKVGYYTFDGIALYQCISIQPGLPIVFILKEMKMEKTKSTESGNSIFIQGHHNMVTTGSYNQIHLEQNNWKGSIDKFTAELERLQLPAENIAEIVEIVQNSQPGSADDPLPQKAVPWISKMVAKAVHGVWEVSTHTAGSLLAEVIKGYYF